MAKDTESQANDPESTQLVDQVRAYLQAEVPTERNERREQVLVLADFVEQTLRRYSSARAHEIATELMPVLREEVVEISASIDDAAEVFLSNAEALEAIAGELDEAQSQRVFECTTKIFEACGFHDLAGQRLTKVGDVLDQIEIRLKALGQGEDGTLAEPEPVPEEPEPDEDEKLLNGPQAQEKALSQDDIDALLNG